MRADVDVTTDLARALLAEQHPDLAGLPLTLAANGWDNVMLRLGDELALRLPRREAAAGLVRHEQAALPRLADRLRADVPGVAVPTPVRVGRPSVALSYPWWWSVTAWIDGVSADRTPVANRTAWAETFGTFLATLHVPAPDDAPENPVRGVPLQDRAEAADGDVLDERLARVPAPWRGRALDLWHDALDARPYGGPPRWLHGDPHPANLVVGPPVDRPGGDTDDDADRLAAVVDWGDVTAGDPASDLGALWLCFDIHGRARCRAVVQERADDGRGWDDATWRRAAGWALLYATNLLAHPDLHPAMVPIGTHGLAQLLDDG